MKMTKDKAKTYLLLIMACLFLILVAGVIYLVYQNNLLTGMTK